MSEQTMWAVKGPDDGTEPQKYVAIGSSGDLAWLNFFLIKEVVMGEDAASRRYWLDYGYRCVRVTVREVGT